MLGGHHLGLMEPDARADVVCSKVLRCDAHYLQERRPAPDEKITAPLARRLYELPEGVS